MGHKGYRRGGHRSAFQRWEVDGFDIVDYAEALEERVRRETEKKLAQEAVNSRVNRIIKPLSEHQIMSAHAEGALTDTDLGELNLAKRPTKEVLLRYVRKHNKGVPANRRVSLNKIAAAYGVSRSKMWNWLQDSGIDLRREYYLGTVS